MTDLPCKECGGQCCTPPAMSKSDAARIMRYTSAKAELNGEFWMLADSWDTSGNLLRWCPVFDSESKTCTIYKFRPTVCRKYGVVKLLPCLYLYPEKEKYFMTHQGRNAIHNTIRGR